MQESGSAAHAHSPAERATGHSRAARKDVVVFTNDDDFLLSIGPAMDDRYRSRPTDGTGAWSEVVRGRSGVALIDAAALENAAEIARTLEAEFPAFALVVIAPAAAQAQWSLALSRGSIARLLDRDSLTKEILAAALTIEPRIASTAPRAAPAAATDGSLSGRARMLVIGGAGIAALAVAGALWMWLGRSTPPVKPASSAPTIAAPATPAAAPAPETASVPEMLSAARMAFSERRYLEPAGGSALELYTHVLAAEAGNAEAEDGVRRVIAVAAAQVQAQIKAGQLDDASRLLATLQAASPADATVAAVEQELAAARPKWLVARARDAISNDQYPAAERLIDELAALSVEKAAVQDLRRSMEGRRKDADLSRAVADARASLGADSLLDGAANGPRAKLAALQQIDRKNAQVVAFQREYQGALLRSGRDATRAGNLASAERYLAAATELGSSRDVTEARKELQTARDTLAAQETARVAAAQQSAERESTQAAAAKLPAPRMPKARKRGAPDYPPAAERDGIEGSVTVEYGLTPEGRTRDIKIVESTPPGVFDAAAVDAVRGWRYESIAAQDAARLPRASVRLAFKIGDKK